MSFFHWTMRNGAIILFLATLLIFVVSLANYYFFSGEALNQALSVSGHTQSKFVIFWGAVAQALNNCVWPFLGACLLNRLDRHWGEAGALRK